MKKIALWLKAFAMSLMFMVVGANIVLLVCAAAVSFVMWDTTLLSWPTVRLATVIGIALSSWYATDVVAGRAEL